MYWDSLSGEDMFLLTIFLMIVFSSVLENNYNQFFQLFEFRWWEIGPQSINCLVRVSFALKNRVGGRAEFKKFRFFE